MVPLGPVPPLPSSTPTLLIPKQPPEVLLGQTLQRRHSHANRCVQANSPVCLRTISFFAKKKKAIIDSYVPSSGENRDCGNFPPALRRVVLTSSCKRVQVLRGSWGGDTSDQCSLSSSTEANRRDTGATRDHLPNNGGGASQRRLPSGSATDAAANAPVWGVGGVTRFFQVPV